MPAPPQNSASPDLLLAVPPAAARTDETSSGTDSSGEFHTKKSAADLIQDKPAAASAPGTVDATRSDTPIHHPRYFLYLCFLLIPTLFVATYLASPTSFAATVSTPSSGPYDARAGLFQVCVAEGCADVERLCRADDNTNGAEPLSALRAGLCDGAARKVAAAMALGATVAAGVALFIYIDAFLIWTNRSFLFKPSSSSPSRALRLRRLLVLNLLAAVAAHLLLTVASLAAALVMRGQMVADQTTTTTATLSVRPFWGVWAAAAAVVADAAFIGLFGVFHRATFFAVPRGSRFDPIMDAGLGL